MTDAEKVREPWKCEWQERAEKAEAEVARLTPWHERWEERWLPAQARIQELEAAIRVYTSPLHLCGTKPCSCGAYTSLTQALVEDEA